MKKNIIYIIYEIYLLSVCVEKSVCPSGKKFLKQKQKQVLSHLRTPQTNCHKISKNERNSQIKCQTTKN